MPLRKTSPRELGKMLSIRVSDMYVVCVPKHLDYKIVKTLNVYNELKPNKLVDSFH